MLTMLKALWRGWLVVAKKIGEFQSRVILSLVYIVVIAPFALAVRLFSDPLGLRSAPSWHWLSRDSQSSPNLDSVRQQF